MSPPTANGTPSPSASSVFLPLGRRARRDSLASAGDQDALSDALDSIHTAASQSQVLTVFNEYTDPPPATSGNEAKSLAGELQGGLSGLYNKLKATVSGAKDSLEEAAKSPELGARTDVIDFERPPSKPSSGRVSRVQS